VDGRFRRMLRPSDQRHFLPPVNAILLTVFVGFVLVGFFVILFLLHRRDAETSSAERDSLMPLEEEMTRVVGKPDQTLR